MVVVPTTNTAPFAEVVAVLAAVARPERTTSEAAAGPAFSASFAVDRPAAVAAPPPQAPSTVT